MIVMMQNSKTKPLKSNCTDHHLI
uniref:Uncharacterized protein n=1 Tax=Arundo donax TaxID=35708 RepID=A0A0A9SA37_ARUDO